MKAYVIKNKEGKYFRGISQPKSTNIPTRIYGRDICDAQIWEDEDSVKFALVESKNEYHQQITICEGDLEEENRVLKKALELACETIHSMMPDKPLWICGDALARKYNIPNTPTIKDYDYFIQQAKESDK